MLCRVLVINLLRGLDESKLPLPHRHFASHRLGGDPLSGQVRARGSLVFLTFALAFAFALLVALPFPVAAFSLLNECFSTGAPFAV